MSSILKFFQSVGSSINYAFYVQGISRAAAELSRQGYYKESRELMKQIGEIKY